MRRNRIIFLLGICAFTCIIMVWLHFQQSRTAITAYKQYNNFVLGIPVASSSEILSGKEKRILDGNPGICFEDTELPFDEASHTFYLAQNFDEDLWTGHLSVQAQEENWLLYAAEDGYWQKKREAIRENHSFTFWLVGESSYYEFHLLITGMPVISISTEYTEIPEEVDYEVDPDKKWYGSEVQHYGVIRVFDPGNGQRQYELVESRVNYHKKGASTFHFEKAGYSLSLLDNRQENLDVSLLGMRSDNSWKLNALVTDNTKVREKTAAQIWECFDLARTDLNEEGPRMEYAELILDGDYRGIYCLVEPVDEKKLELDNNDILYKIINWQPPIDEDIQYSIDRGWRIIYPIRIRYPKVINDYHAAWTPIRDYLNAFYRPNELPVEELSGRVNVDNLFDMVMFTMATSASDNSFKNTYYVAEVSNAGGYVMKQIPWDLDYTFGNIYQYETHNNVVYDPEYDKIYVEESLYRLLEGESGLLGEKFWSKWKEYRENFLDFQNMARIFEDNRNYLIQTGAVIREEQRWQESLETDLTEMLEYVEQRLLWLDGYFYELSGMQ